MIKKIIKYISIFLITCITLFLSSASLINAYRTINIKDDDYHYLSNNANKVILFIGDGMGQNHISNANLYYGKDLFFTSFEKKGLVNTNSKNTFYPTDSAAAATAMSTGKKVYNTCVAKTLTSKDYESISEIAKRNGYGVGIVTTDTLTGATPAAFSAHAKKRSHTEEIIKSQLENSIDLYMGAGMEVYEPYKQQWIEKDYKYINNTEELENTNQKIFATFASINNYEGTNLNPTLPYLTSFAINYFENKYPNGYFLMIEGAHIDKSNHSNNMKNMLAYIDEFDNSIKLAYDRLNDSQNVCFIVTADHESGKLSLADNKNQINDDLYKSHDHTKRKVNYFIHQSNNENINNINEEIDNTHIFYIVKQLLNI